MALVIRIDTDNDAFEGGKAQYEINQIVQKIVAQIWSGLYSAPIHDSNGNSCGFYQYPADNRLLTKVDEYWDENTGIVS